MRVDIKKFWKLDRMKWYGQVERVKGYRKQRGEKLLCLS